MSTAPALDTEPSTTNNNDDGDILHYYCDCEPEIAVCGKDLTGTAEVEKMGDNDQLCVVCEELFDFPCKRCGE